MDWIYIEVWDYPPEGQNVNDLRHGMLIDSTSALLLSDGTVAGLDGNKYVSFDHLKDNDYYILIKHRNHLSILSANAVTFTAGTIEVANTIDFTQKMENAFDNERPVSKQDPLKMINGKCLMYAGELNGDHLISVKDAVIVKTNVNKVGYDVGDISLDARVNAFDKSIVKANAYIHKKF